MKTDIRTRARLAARWAQTGLLANAALAVIKLITGVVGHSYALVADAVESAADVLGSMVVWGGLRLSAREASTDFPFGFGKAESLAAAIVSLMLMGAAAGIAIVAVREILTPHFSPAPYTLVVLVLVVVVKELLFRRVFQAGETVDSLAARADAWHHRSDAITSAAAALGITVALVGGPAYAAADDWAALVAAGIILLNAVRILRPALGDLMDRSPPQPLLERIQATAAAVDGVRRIETLRVRRSGLGLFVDIHVEADPLLSLREAHVLSGKVKSALLETIPQVISVLVHMEPHEPEPGT